jgi:hypothetical protein
MFRSESKSENKFHDYIYHNVGDRVSFAGSDGKSLDIEITDRYQNDIGDVVKSPGWRFFEDTKTTKPVSDEVKVRFDIDYDNKYMHVFFPAGAEKEFTKAFAPPTREAKNGYVKKNTPVMVVRQKGEAWNRPFVAAFEPSGNKKSSIVSTEQLTYKDKVVGMKVVTELDNNTDITSVETNPLLFFTYRGIRDLYEEEKADHPEGTMIEDVFDFYHYRLAFNDRIGVPNEEGHKFEHWGFIHPNMIDEYVQKHNAALGYGIKQALEIFLKPQHTF